MTITTEQLKERAKFWREALADGTVGTVVLEQAILMFAAVFEELAEARELLDAREAVPVYQYRMRNPYNGQVTDWETTKPENVDLILKETIAANVEFRIVTAPPAPAVPDFGALTKLIVGRLIGCGAAGDDSIADAETFVYNACRAAMLENCAINEASIGAGLVARTGENCAAVIPEGYKLVPVDMTDAIGEAIAMEANCCGGIALAIYEAALAAAPEVEE